MHRADLPEERWPRQSVFCLCHPLLKKGQLTSIAGSFLTCFAEQLIDRTYEERGPDSDRLKMATVNHGWPKGEGREREWGTQEVGGNQNLGVCGTCCTPSPIGCDPGFHPSLFSASNVVIYVTQIVNVLFQSTI